MKPTEHPLSQPPTQKKQSDKQLKQLIDSYYTQVGLIMLPILSASLLPLIDTKAINQPNDHNNKSQSQKRTELYGKMILLSTGIVLLSTMIGVFDKSFVLAFGLFWGVVFTKYQAKLENQLTEMLLYWMILALLTALQNILSLALFFMPFYHSLKLFLIISLLYPQINLKSRIYKDYFYPRLCHLSQTISQSK